MFQRKRICFYFALILLISGKAYAYQLISNFDTSVNQVTQASDAVVKTPGFIRHEYSRRPAFNSDGTLAIEYSSNGFFHLYSVNSDNTLSYRHILDEIGGGVIEPNWHPIDPNLLYTLNTYGIGLQLNLYDVRDQRLISVTDMGNKIRALGGGFATADRAFTGEEGRPSRDGNIWCLAVYSGESWTMAGMVAYDLAQDQIIASREISEGPDSVSTSPNGNYCISIGGWGGSGIRSYPTSDPDFSTFMQIHQAPEHTDLALDANGREVLVYIDSQNDGHVKAIDLETGHTVPLFNTWDTYNPPAAHFSGMGYVQPGWVVVSMFGGSDVSFYHNKILGIELTENPQIIVLADALFGVSNEYFAQPQATVNYQLDKVLFSSNASGNIADYMISINQDLPVARGILNNATVTNPGGSGSGTTPTPDNPPPSQSFAITSEDRVYFQEDGNITVTIQTSAIAQCRWDYSDGGAYPYDVLYQDITSTDGLSHVFDEYAWNDHDLYIVCRSQDNIEVDQVIHVQRNSGQTTTSEDPALVLLQVIGNDAITSNSNDSNISVKTNINSECRYDYFYGEALPFGAYYLVMNSDSTGLSHNIDHQIWSDHTIVVVCRSEDGREGHKVIDIKLVQ